MEKRRREVLAEWENRWFSDCITMDKNTFVGPTEPQKNFQSPGE